MGQDLRAHLRALVWSQTDVSRNAMPLHRRVVLNIPWFLSLELESGENPKNHSVWRYWVNRKGPRQHPLSDKFSGLHDLKHQCITLKSLTHSTAVGYKSSNQPYSSLYMGFMWFFTIYGSDLIHFIPLKPWPYYMLWHKMPSRRVLEHKILGKREMSRPRKRCIEHTHTGMHRAIVLTYMKQLMMNLIFHVTRYSNLTSIHTRMHTGYFSKAISVYVSLTPRTLQSGLKWPKQQLKTVTNMKTCTLPLILLTEQSSWIINPDSKSVIG